LNVDVFFHENEVKAEATHILREIPITLLLCFTDKWLNDSSDGLNPAGAMSHDHNIN
jgi:hypothetical protein